MVLEKLMFAGMVLVAAPALVGCVYGDESESDPVAEAQEALGPSGSNNVSPQAVDSRALARGNTNAAGITSPTMADPAPLCDPSTVTATGCTMKPEWESWLNADSVARSWMMKGIAKCSVESTFTITTANGSKSFPGQWPLYPDWKNNRLNGADKRERVSACILALLNGNNESLQICIVGPGAPFDAACTDPNIKIREAGFFGDLFAANPTAYVAGPDTDEVLVNGRVCAATQGTYCCAENDTTCAHHIVLAGAILGSPDQNFANKRCNALAASGSFEYCTSFYSTREPNRAYTNVFTTFVPEAQ